MKKLEISRGALLKIYDNMTVKEALIELSVCSQTFYDMLDAAQIPRKRKDFKRGESIKYIITD